MRETGEQDTDAALMRLASTGDRRAFDAIVRRHQHLLQRVATRLLAGDADGASDVVVSAFVKLWSRREAYRPTGSLSAYLLATVNRLCLDAQSRRRWEPLTEQACPCDPPSGFSEAVRLAVSGLPEGFREVAVLSIFEQMSYDQIAEVLEIPMGTVASRKSAAIERLRKSLAAWEK